MVPQYSELGNKNTIKLSKGKMKALESCVRVFDKLKKQCLILRDVKRILDISKAKVDYWDLKGLQLSESSDTGKKSWRRFSITDLIGFSIISELRKLGLQINSKTCKRIYDWLRSGLQENDFLIYQLSQGKPLFLFADEFNIKYFFGFDKSIWENDISWMKRPAIILRVDPFFRSVLERSKRDDFYVKFEPDEMGGKNRIIYYVDGKRTEIKVMLTEKVRN